MILYLGCEIGFYGRDCTRTCPSGCMDNQCDPETGDCLFGCHESLTGSKCNEGKYLLSISQYSINNLFKSRCYNTLASPYTSDRT